MTQIRGLLVPNTINGIVFGPSNTTVWVLLACNVWNLWEKGSGGYIGNRV